MGTLRGRLPAFPLDRLILSLEFDGTMMSIMPRPNRARLCQSVGETLSKLVGLPPVVVISGLAFEDLRGRGGLQKAWYVGHHGLSCLESGRDVTWLTTPPKKRFVRRWVQAL